MALVRSNKPEVTALSITWNRVAPSSITDPGAIDSAEVRWSVELGFGDEP